MGFRRIFPGGAQASRESKVDVGSTETEDRKPTCSYVQVSNGAASAEAGALSETKRQRGRPRALICRFFFLANQEFAKNLYIIHRKTTWIRPFSVVYYIGRKAPEPSRCAALAAGEQNIAPVRYYQKEVTSYAHLHPAAAARSARYRRSDL